MHFILQKCKTKRIIGIPDTGSGVYGDASTGTIFWSGCVTNPNYKGSGTGTIDDLGGTY